MKALTCTRESHAALKASPEFRALEMIGPAQHVPAGSYATESWGAYTLISKNCPHCDSTLSVQVPDLLSAAAVIATCSRCSERASITTSSGARLCPGCYEQRQRDSRSPHEHNEEQADDCYWSARETANEIRRGA